MGILNWYKDVKQKAGIRQFEKKINKVSYPHQFVDFEKARTIGFIINVNQRSLREMVILQDYMGNLKKSGKNPVAFEINRKKNAESIFGDTVDTVFVNSETLTFFGLPSKEVLKSINQNSVEILLNLDTSDDMTSRYICGFSNAKTRVGIYQEGLEDFFELMIDLPRDTQIKKILSSFEDYLKMIEK